MRKFKVVKSWPSGPAIGTIGELGLEVVSFNGAWFYLKQLEGFVEEVKEPEFFWWVNFYNRCEIERGSVLTSPCVAPEARFRTKESAELFVQGLKDSHGYNLYRGECDKEKIMDALNDRVK